MKTSKKQTHTAIRTAEKIIRKVQPKPKITGRKIKRKAIVRKNMKAKVKFAKDLRVTEVEICSI